MAAKPLKRTWEEKSLRMKAELKTAAFTIAGRREKHHSTQLYVHSEALNIQIQAGQLPDHPILLSLHKKE